jgi:hypothetical protein
MSVIFEQLRISDDGHTMYIDAHVNKACYFENVYLKRITICTEEQVSELNPASCTNEYVYRKDFNPSAECTLESYYDKTQVLTAEKLLDVVTEKGCIPVTFTAKEESMGNYLSCIFSGDFAELTTGQTPVMVIAEPSFNPATDPINSEKVLFRAEGTQIPYEERSIWQFKAKGDLQGYTTVEVYLFSQDGNGVYTQVPVQSTADKNFLHFYWQVYNLIPQVNQKELHLVLNTNDFNIKTDCNGLSKHMYFVYIETVGLPSDCTPCRLDEMTTLGVTFDYGVLYQKAMGYIRELADNCQVSQGFMDFILNNEALKFSIETEHYTPAIQIWKRLVNGGGGAVSFGTTKPCGCHG